MILVARYALITPEETTDEQIEEAMEAANVALADWFDQDEDAQAFFSAVAALRSNPFASLSLRDDLQDESDSKVEDMLHAVLDLYLDEYTITQLNWSLEERPLEDLQ